MELVFKCIGKPGVPVAPAEFQDETFIRLSNLKKLLDSGAITQEEFDREKSKILESHSRNTPPN